MTYKADPELAAVLGDFLAGHRMSGQEARATAEHLRAIVDAAGPVAGPDAALAARLQDAAELLERQADARRRPRPPAGGHRGTPHPPGADAHPL